MAYQSNGRYPGSGYGNRPVRNQSRVRNDPRGRNQEKPSGGPIVLLIQAAVCLLILAGVFTMQFFEPDRFRETGQCYRQLMGAGTSSDTAMQTLASPVDQDFFANLWKKYNPNEILQVFSHNNVAAMGGEEPIFPRNASYAKIVVSAKAHSPLPADAVITSAYGERTHPITGKWDFHTGIDLAAAQGTSILAVYPGTVTAVGSSKTYGNYIVVRHSGNLCSVYCHCSKVMGKKGDSVIAGEKIAEVGSTGTSTGPHLHLSILYSGYYVDPMNLFSI